MDDEQRAGRVPPPDAQGRTSALLLSGALGLVLVCGGAGWFVDRGTTTASVSSTIAVATPPDSGGGDPGRATGGDTGSDPAGATPSSGVAGFGSYINPRFGFRTLYPADFTAQTQNADGDGMQWVGGNEGMTTFTVYGANDPDAATPDEELTTLSQGLDVTYSSVKGDVVTVSGLRDGDTVVYVREALGPGSTATMAWSYPVSEKDRWDPQVSATAAAFTPGDLSTSH